MANELIIEQTWWKRNWKWFLASLLIMSLLLFGLLLNSSVDENITDIAKAYSDNSLYEKAIEKTKTNKRVLEVIGKIEPIDKLAILEGNTKYSNDNNFIETTIRIKGNKATGKMDITALKIRNEWEFSKICIRIKNSNEEIVIIK